MIPFQKSKEWSSLLCSGSFHLSEVIFTEQTGRLIINLHLRGQNLNSPPFPSLSLSLSLNPLQLPPPSRAAAHCYPWSALGFISAEHLFQWLSLPLLSTAVRVKSRALSLDWNHLSHGPGLELIPAEAMVRYTGIPTAPLTRGTGGQPPVYTDGPSILHSHCLPTKMHTFFNPTNLKDFEIGDGI